jgi:hypothetical protein
LLLNAPQSNTVVPGPIWAGPLPQFPWLLKNAGVRTLLVQFPLGFPLWVMKMLVAEPNEGVESKAINAKTTRSQAL